MRAAQLGPACEFEHSHCSFFQCDIRDAMVRTYTAMPFYMQSVVGADI